MQLNFTMEFANELKQKPIETQVITIINYLENIKDISGDKEARTFLLEFSTLLSQIKEANMTLSTRNIEYSERVKLMAQYVNNKYYNHDRTNIQ